MRWSVETRARLVPTLRLVVDQTLYNLGSDDPYDVVEWFLEMNPTHLGSERVTQDVLLLCGEHDSFQPPGLTRAQAAALTSACADHRTGPSPPPNTPISTAKWATSGSCAWCSPAGSATTPLQTRMTIGPPCCVAGTSPTRRAQLEPPSATS